MMKPTDSDLLAMLEGIEYAYFELDLSGILRFVNETFYKSLGYPLDEILDHHYRDFIATQSIRQMEQLFQNAFKTGQAQKGIEINLRMRDGTQIIAEVALVPICDANGQPAGLRGLLHDVTRRRQAEETMQRSKMVAERDLEIGRRIQADFLPQSLPELEGWEFASYFKAAREVAGDFYDAFELSGGKRVGLIIGDVVDKGVGAALFMALFRSLIRAFADQHYSLGWMDVLSNDFSASGEGGSLRRRRAMLSTGTTALKNAIDMTSNYIARNHGRTHMFATVFFGVLDPATGLLMFINAGQEPPVIANRTGIKARLEPTGPAVGLLPGLEFRIGQVDLEPGDILVAYTDGVQDALSPSEVFFTEERLLSLLQPPARSAKAQLKRIQAELDSHIAGRDQYDDITLLAAKRKAAIKAK